MTPPFDPGPQTRTGTPGPNAVTDDAPGTLTDEERRLLDNAPFPGLRPGDNLWPEIEIAACRTGNVIGDGAVVDRLIRRGLLVGTPLWVPRRDRHPDGFLIEYAYLYQITAAGAAALAVPTPIPESAAPPPIPRARA